MKILFDHGTPAPLRNHLREHSVDRSAEKGWELLENGELIRKAEEEGYAVIVTTDQSMRHPAESRWTGIGNHSFVVHRMAQSTRSNGGNPNSN